jgi:hypothetical protein
MRLEFDLFIYLFSHTLTEAFMQDNLSLTFRTDEMSDVRVRVMIFDFCNFLYEFTIKNFPKVQRWQSSHLT